MYKNIYPILNYRGILDDTYNYQNCAFAYSPYYRLSGKFKDELCKVKNTVSGDIRWFGYGKDGSLEKNEIKKFLNGSKGIAKTVNNQIFDGTNYNINQNTDSLCPVICDSNVFNDDGLYFDGVDDHLVCPTHNVPTNQPTSIYCSFKSINNNIEYIFAKNDTTNVVDFAFIQVLGTRLYYKTNTHSLNAQQGGVGKHTAIAYYNNNLKKLKYDEFVVSVGYTTTITDNSNFIIGGYWNGTGINNPFGGYVKSILIFNSNEYDNYNRFKEIL